ncbi:MAG: CHRD domain-containing protein [Gemmatimonadetes bacterium]|nr:CHRD domain-containing protein [Gemmatimonadota bacterium]
MRKSATLFAGMSILALAAMGCSTGVSEATFTTQLAGANEVPPVTTSATGTAQVVMDASVAKYTLTVNGLTGISGAHIHASTSTAAAGATLPISVYLFDGPTTDAATPVNGTLAKSSFNQVTITAAGPTGTGAVSTFDNLRSALEGHRAYANVHTTTASTNDPCPPRCPSGAIRGNF